MIRLVLKYGIAFIMLILFQVLILNNMHLSVYINPYAYILLILILPFETPGWLALSLAFLTGITMDSFSDTMGMHTSAIVFMAFARKYLLDLIAPRDGYEGNMTPHYKNMGFVWFLLYAGILTFMHHIWLFMAEDFRFDHFFSIIFKSILSGIFSMVIMSVLLLISYKPKR